MLGRLTLPNGGSRTALPDPPPELMELKLQGGCLDLPAGTEVVVRVVGRTTSVVGYDAGNGIGPLPFIARNVDFGLAPPVSARAPPAAPPPESRTVATECLVYERAGVTLTGRLERAPIPPDLQQAGTFPQLVLDRPICTQATFALGNFEAGEAEQRALQLVFRGDFPGLDRAAGQRFTVTGMLFHAATGQHFTPVLFTVATIVPAR